MYQTKKSNKLNYLKNPVFVIIGINILIFLIQISVEGFNSSFVLVGADIFTRPWILLTSMFMHADFSHLLFNMWALFMFGPLIQRSIGAKRFIYFYLAAGIFAGLIYGLINPVNAALGASGAIMGVIGMVIMLFPQMKVLMFFAIPMSMRNFGIIVALIDIFGMITPSSGVANLAHLAGLACGLLYGFYLIRKSIKGTIGKIKKKNSTFFKSDPTGKGDMHIPSQAELDNYYKDK